MPVRQNEIWHFQGRCLSAFGKMPNAADKMAVLPAKWAADMRRGTQGPPSVRVAPVTDGHRASPQRWQKKPPSGRTPDGGL